MDLILFASFYHYLLLICYDKCLFVYSPYCYIHHNIEIRSFFISNSKKEWKLRWVFIKYLKIMWKFDLGKKDNTHLCKIFIIIKRKCLYLMLKGNFKMVTRTTTFCGSYRNFELESSIWQQKQSRCHEIILQWESTVVIN